MDKIYVLLMVVVFILYFVYCHIKRKKDLLERIKNSFGKKPRDFKKEFDMSYVKSFYKVRKEYEKTGQFIDEITWNDLDMDAVFKRVNYTNTTLGEALLYYKLKEVNYDKNEWQYTEQLIETFTNDESLRNEIQIILLKVGKLKNFKIFDFIYKPDFNKVPGYYKYPLLAIGFILSIILCFFHAKAGLISTLFFFCTNILFYQKAKMYLEESFNVMLYLLDNIVACQKLCKVNNSGFEPFKKKLQSKLNDCHNLKQVKKHARTLLKHSEGSTLDLDLFLQYIKMFFMVDIIAYEKIMKIFDKNKESFCEIYNLAAQLDFALSVAYYRKSLDEYVKPEFIDDNDIEMINVYHPLIENPIKNSINIKNNIVFTGSNASGKSTFIKTLALNCILAQSLNTALCSKYKCRFSKVMTSMAIKDNVMAGESYFISEIKSLKRLIDSLNNEVRVIAFIDEILKGTNTIERISASAAILKYGQNTKARIIVATHDIELTTMLEEYYDNYHFEETVRDEGVFFDYKLKEGPSRTSNAIKLLKTMDYEPELIDTANKIYNSFIKDKKWGKV